MTITSVSLHYFDLADKPPTVGYGENLNLLLKDSGIDYTYDRYDLSGWPEMKADLAKRSVLHPTMPYVEVDGKTLAKTVPTMRYLARKLGKYMGSNDDENYILECVADSVRDHFGTWVVLVRCDDQEKLKEHFEKDTIKYLGIYDTIYGRNEGPYILGEEISYADFLVYHMLDDDFIALKHVEDYPNVAKFVKAFTKRPNLAPYFDSLK
ncbi:class gamma glutathione S-transferase 2 [Halteromyces radiatus]|uniref:class gamma glutathione S-transferase 2 n=1 Tax=Halteromyces radiatus TaxID=101107 RepID=UPI002220516B|nr:class gamma glutathione S-transferase 2 [Halteromyces radiatus]KAI8084993.1 class gamma glutathione S-transferase 2 [Halteromyces radiatus]